MTQAPPEEGGGREKGSKPCWLIYTRGQIKNTIIFQNISSFTWLHQVSVAALGIFVVVDGLSCPMTCGVLAPQPGIELESPALEGGLLITGPTTKEVPKYNHF